MCTGASRPMADSPGPIGGRSSPTTGSGASSVSPSSRGRPAVRRARQGRRGAREGGGHGRAVVTGGGWSWEGSGRGCARGRKLPSLSGRHPRAREPASGRRRARRVGKAGTLSSHGERRATARAGGRVLPDGFLFGVATAGFQVEGGYNGPGEPANNWLAWEQVGRVQPSGNAVGFWDRPEEALDRAAALGCNSFRLGVEWARVFPDERGVDRAALDRYAGIVGGCIDRGLEPLVTLHHFTHPDWLGEDFWLRPDAPDRYCRWVEVVVEA